MEEFVPCRYHSVGCTFSGTTQEIKEHEENNLSEHMQHVIQLTAETDLKNIITFNSLEDISRDLHKTTNEVRVLKLETNHFQAALQAITKSMKAVKIKSAGLTEKTITLERVAKDLVTREEIDKYISEIQDIREGQQNLNDKIEKIYKKYNNEQPQNDLQRLQAYERECGLQDIKLAEFDLRLQVQEVVSYDGTLLWKIKEYPRRLRDAKNRNPLSLYSQPFHTSRFGYKLCARAYLNGDGIGKDTHLSLYFVVMKGEFDRLLPWPFQQRVTMTLVDQEKGIDHISDSFRPDPNSSSFKKPSTDMNTASGCPLFARHEVVESRRHLYDDAIFIRIAVETLGINI